MECIKLNSIKNNIANLITPRKIITNPLFNFVETPDYGRGILESSFFDFKEKIITESDESLLIKLGICNLDAFILNYILKIKDKIFKEDTEKELYISVPQLSNSFPILITYHLVFSHLARRIQNFKPDISGFQFGEGVLLISHNIDLLQHVWNSKLRGEFLRDYFPTYTIKSNKFKIFNFNNTSNKTVQKDDGSLPWIGFYRAHRRDLPTSLEKKPKYIIIDLIPYYHRKRANELIKWANKFADIVIVILPSNDLNLNYLTYSKKNKLLINQSSLPFLQELVPFNNNSVLKSWGLEQSLKLFNVQNLVFKICEFKTVDRELIRLLKQFEDDLQLCTKTSGEIPLKYQKLDTLRMYLLNTITPLNFYEFQKRTQREFNILDLYHKTKSIFSDSQEEQSIEKNLGHHLYDSFEQLYSYLHSQQSSLRGNLINKQLNLLKSESILVLILDEFEKSYIKQSIISNKHSNSKVEVLTFKEFNNMQISGESITFDSIILSTPFPFKYLSGFNFTNSEVYCISLFNDTTRYYKQIENIYNSPKEPLTFIQSMSSIDLNVNNISRNLLIAPRISLEKISSYQGSNNSLLEDIAELNISVFDDSKLLNLLKSNRTYQLDVIDIEKYTSEKVSSTLTEAVLVEAENSDGNNEQVFVPIEDYLKIHRFSSNKLEILPINKVNTNDLWIQVNQNQRKDLFNEILLLAAKSKIMQWINHGIKIWNEILETVWQKFYNGQQYKKTIYELIRDSINENGGSVSQYLTISNWFNGVNIVRDEQNLIALIKISEHPELLESLRIVLSSFSELRSIRIQLGRAISKLITTYSDNLLNYKEIPEWVTIGTEIVIPTEDIASLLKIVRVLNINWNKTIKIPNEFVYRDLSSDVTNKIIEIYSD